VSILNVDSETGNEDAPRSVETAPSASTRRPTAKTKEESKVEQHKLGGVVLEAVDYLTGMSADQIEVVAERLMDGARETEEVLHELARRVREHGLFASERVANFVKAANNCADVARSLQATLETRDEPPVAQSAAGAQANAADQPAHKQPPVDLNALGAELDILGAEAAPPTQPGEGTGMAAPHPRATGDKTLASRPSRRRATVPGQMR